MASKSERSAQWNGMVMAVADPVARQELSERIFLRTHKACVIEALESGLGVRARDEEYDLRIADLISLEGEFAKYGDVQDPFALLALELTKRELDRQNIRTLFKVLAGRPTQLGKALRKHQWTDENLRAPEIIERVQGGEILLVDIPRRNPGSDRVDRHMVHLGIIDGRLVSLSDDNMEIELNGDQYSVFCFTRR